MKQNTEFKTMEVLNNKRTEYIHKTDDLNDDSDDDFSLDLCNTDEGKVKETENKINFNTVPVESELLKKHEVEESKIGKREELVNKLANCESKQTKENGICKNKGEQQPRSDKGKNESPWLQSKMHQVDDKLEDYEDVIDELSSSPSNVNVGWKLSKYWNGNDSEEEDSALYENSEGICTKTEKKNSYKNSFLLPGVSFLVRTDSKSDGTKTDSRSINSSSLSSKNDVPLEMGRHKVSSKEKLMNGIEGDNMVKDIDTVTSNGLSIENKSVLSRKRPHSSEVEPLACDDHDEYLSHSHNTDKKDSKLSPTKKTKLECSSGSSGFSHPVIVADKTEPESESIKETPKESLQSDVEKVLEMFPDLEEDFVRKKFRLLKSQYQNNIIERVIESLVNESPSEQTTNSSRSPGHIEGDEDVQTAMRNPRLKVQTQRDGNSDSRSEHGKGARSGFGSKGKGPAKKKRKGPMINGDGIILDVEMEGGEWDDVEEPEREEGNIPRNNDNTSMVECDTCRKIEDANNVAQCCNGHIVCKECLEKEVKKILAPDNQQVQFKCPMEGCNSHIPDSQTKRVLPELIVGLLQEKFDKQAVASISKIENLHFCPFCNFPVAVDSHVKLFTCLNEDCKKQSCRYCKKAWLAATHAECCTFTVFEEDANELELPSFWHPMPSDGDKDFITVALKEKSPEFLNISKLFQQTIHRKYTIKSIRRVQNPQLWQKFKLTRKHMTEDIGKNELNERQLFHGTRCKAIESICRGGLDWRMCGENGTSYGQGTYFAREASFSDTYSHKYNGPIDLTNSNDTLVHLSSINQSNSGPFLAFGRNNQPTTAFNFGSSNAFPNAVNNTVTSNVQFAAGLFVLPSPFKNKSNGAQSQPVTGFQPNRNNIHVAGTSQPNQNNVGFGTVGSTNQQTGFGTVTYGTTFGDDSVGNPNKKVPKVSSNIADVLRIRQKYMFVARVLVGRSTNGSHSLRKPPLDPNDPKGRSFNSCVNNVTSPSIFVIFDISQCYPEYLIEYNDGNCS